MKQGLKYIYNLYELQKEIQKHCNKAKTIRFYSSHFTNHQAKADNLYLAYCKSHFIFEEWLKGYLCTLISAQRQIQIYDYCHFDEKDIDESKTFYLDKKWNKIIPKQHKTQAINNEEYIQVFLKQSDTSKILYDFIAFLNPKKKSIDDIIEEILARKDGGKELLKEAILTKLKAPLIKRIVSIKELQIFNQKDTKESIEKIFDNLLKDIEAINQEGNKELIKELLELFLNIINIFNIKKLLTKTNIFITGADLLFEGGGRFLKILEWHNNKYNYAIYKNLIKLLIDDLAPIILLFDNGIFHQSIIIDNKICIEFSGMDIKNFTIKANIKQELAVCFKADREIFSTKSHLDDLRFNILNDYEKDSAIIFGKNHIEKILKEQMHTNNNRLTFIESPFFNSIKLAKIIEENQQLQKEKNESYNIQNYLLITNAPRKYNAGLNQKLMENILGNKIYYPDMKDEKNNEILSQAPKDYETTINYSRYKISINQETKEDKTAFVLSLSPFVCIDYAEYEEFKKSQEKYLELKNNPSDKLDDMQEYLNFKSNANNIEKVLNYYHIQQYFIQAKNKQAILEKEKQYFKEGIDCIQEYIKSIIQEVKITYDSYNTDYATSVSKEKFSIIDVFLLSLTLYVIKNFYISISKEDKSWWEIANYESLIIENQEELQFLPLNVWLSLEENKNIPLCLSKKRKQELEKYFADKKESIFCIEEFVELMEKDKDKNEVNILKQYLESKFEREDFENFKAMENIIEKELKEQNNIAETIEKIYQDLKKQSPKYDEQKILELILETFIDEFFPLKNALEDTTKFAKLFSKAFIKYCYKGIQEAFYTLLGYAYLSYVILKNDVKFSQSYFNEKKFQVRKNELTKKALSSLILEIKNQKNYQILILSNSKELETLKNSKIKTLKIKSQFFIKAFKKTNKEFLKALPQAIVVNLMDQLWVSHYEKIKKEHERLFFLKFTDKYNQPYAIERKPSLETKGNMTYPMSICNTFISSNFVSMIVGSKLQTGGLGEKEALFFLQRDMVKDDIKTHLVNKLFAYLCLDELRAMNKDLTKTIGDLEFFTSDIYKKTLTKLRLLKLKHGEDYVISNHLSKSQKENMQKYNQELQAINNDKARNDLYQEYKKKEIKGLEAIDAYHQCIDYLADINEGIFNIRATDNSLDPTKHRKFLENLDLIGQNNIKALYVGINKNKIILQKQDEKDDEENMVEATESKKEEKNPPKMVGRLATTIIMKNGLHMG